MSREVIERDIRQGSEERIAYSIDATPWASGVAFNACQVYRVTGGARVDVTSTVCTGSGSVTDNVITLPAIGSLTSGDLYRVEVRFTAGSNIFETYFYLRGED